MKTKYDPSVLITKITRILPDGKKLGVELCEDGFTQEEVEEKNLTINTYPYELVKITKTEYHTVQRGFSYGIDIHYTIMVNPVEAGRK